MKNTIINFLTGRAEWHVAFVGHAKGRNLSHGDGVYTFSKKMKSVHLKALRKTLSDELNEAAGEPIFKPENINITGVTRL